MASETDANSEARRPLTRERVLRAAVALADERGIESLTMRRLGEALGVKAMSLYNHVANKEDLLEGMVDVVFGEIDPPPPGTDWKAAMRRRAISARGAFSRHPWATGLMQSRSNLGPATSRHHDSVIGCLREAGFSIEMTANAYTTLDSYVFGFALQETSSPHASPEEAADAAAMILRQLPAHEYPHLAEMITEYAMKPGYDPSNEFEFGLDLLLDGLGRFRDTA